MSRPPLYKSKRKPRTGQSTRPSSSLIVARALALSACPSTSSKPTKARQALSGACHCTLSHEALAPSTFFFRPPVRYVSKVCTKYRAHGPFKVQTHRACLMILRVVYARTLRNTHSLTPDHVETGQITISMLCTTALLCSKPNTHHNHTQISQFSSEKILLSGCFCTFYPSWTHVSMLSRTPHWHAESRKSFSRQLSQTSRRHPLLATKFADRMMGY